MVLPQARPAPPWASRGRAEARMRRVLEPPPAPPSAFLALEPGRGSHLRGSWDLAASRHLAQGFEEQSHEITKELPRYGFGIGQHVQCEAITQAVDYRGQAPRGVVG